MPKLDGVSATTQIRQFDAMTPIISMTSNTTANDIMTYFANGMNDILPKPFSKDSLLSMLEKHCQHLRYLKLGTSLLELSNSGAGSNLNGQANRLLLRQGDSADVESMGFSLSGFQGQDGLQLVQASKDNNNVDQQGGQNGDQQQQHREGIDSLGMGMQLNMGGMMILNNVDSNLDGRIDSYPRQNQNNLKHGNENDNNSNNNNSNNYGMNNMSYGELMDPIGHHDESSSSSLSPDQAHSHLSAKPVHHQQHTHHSHQQQQQQMQQGHQGMMTNPHSNHTGYTTTMGNNISFSNSNSSMMSAYQSELDNAYGGHPQPQQQQQHQQQQHQQQQQQQHQQHQQQPQPLQSITLLSIRPDGGMAHTLGLANRGGGFGMDQGDTIDTQEIGRASCRERVL